MFELTPFARRALRYDPFFFVDREASFSAPVAFRTDIKDEGAHFLIEAELPGFKKEEIDISLEKDVLTVRAQRKEEKEEKDASGYVRKERHYGSYSKSFDLSGIDSEQISASLENGILTLKLPKKEKEVPTARKIALA
ncbi:MAG: Hsp20/alpha crystallin family protein [Clostridia bacterium]|nr:Hsp20/alpha crystallin family protein [Clostridia bacterium]